MQIVIQPVDIDVTAGLNDYIHERLNKFFGKQDYITGIDVYVKKANEKNTDEHIVEAKVYLPGPELYADSSAGSFHAALNETIDKLRRQLEKYKEVHFAHRP